MKIALVHDQLNEFGGAERVLLALTAMFPDAPIYTAYYKKGSLAWERFKRKDIRVSWAHSIPWFATKLHSPLRFLAPFIWNSFDFTQYDLIIGSSSWYITKGFARKGNAKELCYCHTPPRWLYGYPTSVDWQRYLLVRMYAAIVGFFMRQYDFTAAQSVDMFIANSMETQKRISKFYRRESAVIYPPIAIASNAKTQHATAKKDEYYLLVARMVGGKGISMAVEAAVKMGFHLKVVGVPAGYTKEYESMQKYAGAQIEFLGYVSDEKLSTLYTDARAFLALSTNEDFGMTPVEAMSAGTPVIAYNGGGYPESVIDGKTGVLFSDSSIDGLIKAIQRFESIKKDWRNDCQTQAKKFSTKRFVAEMNMVIQKMMR